MRTKPKAIKIAWFEKYFLGKPVLIGDNKQGAGAVFLVVVVFVAFLSELSGGCQLSRL